MGESPEEFSVSQLAEFRKHSRMENDEALEELVSRNLSSSQDREYDYQGDFSDKDTDQTLSILVHDAAVNLYDRNEEVDVDEAFQHMSSHINDRISETQNLDRDVIWRDVYGASLKDVVQDAAEYYAENLQTASEVATEEVLENQGFHGRADVIREVDGETEIRDVKTRYSDAPSMPGPEDEFKMACYALISRGELEVDRFVLEYPLQGEEVEVEPEEWFAEVANRANEFGRKLDESREKQARLLENELGLKTDMAPREFVEGLNLGYDKNRETAQAAAAEALR